MTPRQSLALSSVLTNPDNTEGVASFAKTIVNDAGRFGTILTVDQFESQPTWHVCVFCAVGSVQTNALGTTEAFATRSCPPTSA